MNQAVKSVVRTMPPNSEEYSIVQSLCTTAVDENVTNSVDTQWATFQKLLVKVTSLVWKSFCANEFIKKKFQVSQSCEEMLISCVYGGVEFNCTDIFVTVLTDEGLCCTFNAVNRKFIAKPQFKLASPITDGYPLISVKSWAFTVSAFEAEWISRNWFLRFRMFCRKIWCSKL